MIPRVSRPVYGAVVASLAAAALLAAGTGGSLAFERFNGTYVDLAPQIVPVEAGGLALTIASPSNSVTLAEHEVRVTPLGDGVFELGFAAEIEGDGELVLSFGSSVPPLSDAVVLPRQRVALAGTAAVARVEGGWEVTTRELPETASLRVESALAGRLVATCELLAVAVPTVECDGLAPALSVVRLPLPEPGETYFVEATVFTQDEVERIDRALGFAG